MIIRDAVESDLPAIVLILRICRSALIGSIHAHKSSVRLFHRSGFERWGFLPRVTRIDGVDRDVVIMGRHVSVQA